MKIDAKQCYGGFFRRTGAVIIDNFIFYLIFSLFNFALSGRPIFDLGMSEGSLSFGEGFTSFEQLFSLLITVVMWVKFSGTPGKLLLDCHVVDARTGHPISYMQGLIRYVCYIVSIIPFGLGFFWILWDKRKQGFHDKIAKTVVIQLEQEQLGEDESTKSLDQLLREVR